MHSDNVGWANMLSRIWDSLRLTDTARVKIAISSVALGPMIEAPRICSVFLSETTLIKPSVSSIMRAMPEPKKSNLFIFVSIPLFFASASLKPILAISGSVKMQFGIFELSAFLKLFGLAIFSAAIRH